MRNAFKAVLPFAAIALSGCSSPQIKSIDFGLIVANSSDVKSCLLISDVHGVSGLYGVFADTGLQKARLQAMAQASELGASHIVWTDFEVVYGSTTAHANAYLCPTTESASEPEKAHKHTLRKALIYIMFHKNAPHEDKQKRNIQIYIKSIIMSYPR